jgi:hypothetical protein
MFHILRMSLVTVAACRTQNRTLGSSSILRFIALQSSSEILKTRIKYTKDSNSKFSCKRCGMIPKNEVNPRFHGLSLFLIVGEVQDSLPRLNDDSPREANSNLLRWQNVLIFCFCQKISKTFGTPLLSTIYQK